MTYQVTCKCSVFSIDAIRLLQDPTRVPGEIIMPLAFRFDHYAEEKSMLYLGFCLMIYLLVSLTTTIIAHYIDQEDVKTRSKT